MSVTVYLSDGGHLSIENFDPATALDLREGLDEADRWLTFEMDGDTVVVQTRHVVRIDFEH